MTIRWVIWALIILFVGSVITLVLLGHDQNLKALQPAPHEVGGILAPSQDAYRKDPQITSALSFLSRRWNTPVDTIYILAVRRIPSVDIELGAVDSFSLTSARLFVPTQDYSEKQLLDLTAHGLIAHEGKIYLANEFRPSSPEQLSIARQFYVTETPSLNGSDFAVVVWWNVAESGDGYIKGLTNSGYVEVPVEHGRVDKPASIYED